MDHRSSGALERNHTDKRGQARRSIRRRRSRRRIRGTPPGQESNSATTARVAIAGWKRLQIHAAANTTATASRRSSQGRDAAHASAHAAATSDTNTNSLVKRSAADGEDTAFRRRKPEIRGGSEIAAAGHRASSAGRSSCFEAAVVKLAGADDNDLDLAAGHELQQHGLSTKHRVALQAKPLLVAGSSSIKPSILKRSRGSPSSSRTTSEPASPAP